MSPLEKHGFCGDQINDYKNEIRNKYRDCLELSFDTNTLCQTSMYELVVHNEDGREVVTSSLYIRSLNSYQAVLILAERGMIPQARSMARTMLESIFTLCAVCKSESLIDVYIDEDHKKRLKLIEKFRQFHGGEFPPEYSPEEIEELREELRAKYPDGKIRMRTTEQWAKDADLEDWYLTVYALLSDSVHTKVSDLERHLAIGEDGKVTEMLWGPDPEGIEDVLYASVEAMTIALDHVCKIFDVDRKSDLDTITKRLKRLVS